MLKIKSIKKEGRNVFSNNVWKAIAICFIVTIITGGTTIGFVKGQLNFIFDTNVGINNSDFTIKSNISIIDDFIESSKLIGNYTDKYLSRATRGVLATFANSINRSDSFIFGVLNAINEMAFKNRVGQGIVILVGVIIVFLYWLLVSNVFIVGKARFFLKNRRYKRTKLDRVIFPYKDKKIKNIMIVMFKKELYNFLWSFTIVGGFIKHYSYFFIPYILAENPNMRAKEVFALSRKMAYGNKRRMFLFDLSFIGYDILGIVSLNVSNLLYKTPYKSACEVELYMKVRNDYISDKKEGYEYLNDAGLNVNYFDGEYSDDSRIIKDDKNLYSWKINLVDMLLLFLTYSLIGYIWEVMLHLISSGEFVNRGSMYGPWIPIYGYGGLITLLLLKKYKDNPVKVFFLSMAMCGVIEYSISWIGELIYHIRWWDYTGYLFNINGRVCLEGLLVFGFACTINIFWVTPLLLKFFHRFSDKKLKIIAGTLMSVFIVDMVYSIFIEPNKGDNITTSNSYNDRVLVEKIII